MRLGKLPLEAIELFSKNIILDLDIKVSNDAILKLLELVQGHPFYTIKVLQEGFICLLLEGKNRSSISETNIDQAIAKILFDNAIYFETLWQKINSKKHKGSIIKELAIKELISSDKVNLSYKSQMIRELKDEGILDENKQFLDPLFFLWLQKTN